MHPLTIIDDFLDHDDLEAYISYIDTKKTTQSIIDDPELTVRFWDKYKVKLQPLIQGIYQDVTVSKSSSPIVKHRDNLIHQEKYKLLLYLNSVPQGGTYFYLKEGKQLVENKENRLVIFDIKLFHESQVFHKKHVKYAIGFRAKD